MITDELLENLAGHNTPTVEAMAKELLASA